MLAVVSKRLRTERLWDCLGFGIDRYTGYALGSCRFSVVVCRVMVQHEAKRSKEEEGLNEPSSRCRNLTLSRWRHIGRPVTRKKNTVATCFYGTIRTTSTMGHSPKLSDGPLGHPGS